MPALGRSVPVAKGGVRPEAAVGRLAFANAFDFQLAFLIVRLKPSGSTIT
jgi:hypothetical protein